MDGPSRRLQSVPVAAWLRLTRADQKIQRVAAQQLRDAGLSTAQFDVLAHVGAKEGLAQQALADALLVTKGNVCQLLDRMEASGVLERRPEGRTNRVYLTEQGRALYRRIVPAHESLIAEQLSALSAEEQRQLLGLLRRLDRSLREGHTARPAASKKE